MSTQFEPGISPPGFLPLSVPVMRGNEWAYVRECLDTAWISSAGPFVDRFENELAAYVGADHAVATVNGTSALHVSLIVAGVGPGDEVIVPSLTFIAPANAVRYAGAWPVFLDVDPDYWQLDPAKVAEFLSTQCEWTRGSLKNKTTDRRVRALLPVDILGHPCDMDPLIELARKYELAVIEDATESLGAGYKGRMAGTLGDIGCFSFNGNKLISTGGGGMIVTNNDSWGAKARYLTTQAKNDALEYVHNEIGYNYRLTNVLAAIGCAQLERIDEHIASKRQTARRYSACLAEIPGIECMSQAHWASSVFWLFTALFDVSIYGLDRRRLLEVLHDHRIQARPLWQPMHLSPAHKDAFSCNCEVAEGIWRRALSLPCSVGISEEDILRVARVLTDAGMSH
jgi:perosamine synthetase